jgi:arginase
MKVELIYATWPNSPGGIHWRKMAGAMRKAGLTNALKKAGFQLSENAVEATGEDAAELKTAFELGAQIGALVRAAGKTGSLSLVICGSCSVAALGAICGLGGEDTGILWMDAHADLNTPETTLSGLFEGMAASIVLGEAWQAMSFDIAGLTPVSRRNLCFYGARDLDPPEEAFIDEESIAIVEDAEGSISALDDCRKAYIHLDMDVHDAAALRVNKYSGKGGPSPEDVRAHLTAVAAALPVAALSITGLDPDLADEGAIRCAIEHGVAVCEAWRDAQT